MAITCGVEMYAFYASIARLRKLRRENMREIRLFGHYVKLDLLFLSLMDVLVVGSVFYAAVGGVSEKRNESMVLILIGSCIAVLTKASVGLYQFQLRVDWRGIVMRLVAAFLLGFPVVFGAGMLLRLDFSTLALMVSAGALAYGFTGFIHAGFIALADSGLLGHRVLVLGAGESAASLLMLRRRADRRGFQVAGFVPLEEVNPTVSLLLRPDKSLCEFAKERGIQEIVVALEERRNALPMGELVECRFQGMQVTDLAAFLERETGKVHLDLLHPGWLVFDGNRIGPAQEAGKRVLDIIFASALLLLALPIVIVTVMAIAREDGWSAPWLYRQERVGKSGKVFQLVKFRSMRVDAEEDGHARWASARDERVTRVGRIIRKLRVDEIPQLWNVLRGEMSLVGPRPERPEFVAELSRNVPFYAERHRIKPGITGWAQILYPYGASSEDAREKLAYDMYYLKNRSLVLDIIILVQTVEVVLFGKGAR